MINWINVDMDQITARAVTWYSTPGFEMVLCSFITWRPLIGQIRWETSFWKCHDSETDLPRDFPESFMFIAVLQAQSLPASVTAISSPNQTNRIPFSPSLSVGYDYGNAFVQRLTHAKNLSKEVSHAKVQIKISSSILNGFTRFKLQFVLCREIYLNHMLISRIEEFEFLPSWSAARDSVFVSLRLMKTDGV